MNNSQNRNRNGFCRLNSLDKDKDVIALVFKIWRLGLRPLESPCFHVGGCHLLICFEDLEGTRKVLRFGKAERERNRNQNRLSVSAGAGGRDCN